MTIRPDSKAQQLAWELKDAAWREVEHLPLAEALRRRLADSAAAAGELGLRMPVRDPRGASAVREEGTKYGDTKEQGPEPG
jgi:hypothetical protein